MWSPKLVLQGDPVPRLNLSLWSPPPSRALGKGQRKGKHGEDGGGAGGKAWGWRERASEGKRRGGQPGFWHAPSLGPFLSHKRRQRAHQSCPAPAPAAAATAWSRAHWRLERPGDRGPRRRRAPPPSSGPPLRSHHHRLSRGSRGPGSFHLGRGEGGGGRGTRGIRGTSGTSRSDRA